MTDDQGGRELEFDGTTRAVFYLRVSTKEQAERGGREEGFSIPAQRQACERKAETLGATIVDEFVDRGESAKSAARPELQRMLTYLADNPTTFVIVHKLDRLARNRVDDVEINVAIKTAGATLVSCTENIDETPSGTLMHGIMSSIAEFYSRNLANEVVKGTTQKAMAGGTIGKAPTGYRNIRRIENHREVRTVELDEFRAPLMRWAFEQYATGEWSVRRLLVAVTDKGLTSIGGPKRPEKPLSLGNFNRLLKNDYYIGIVTYKGVKYQGTHEPLISEELFNKVQNVLTAKKQSGERQRTHRHYLKGTVFCIGCESRMIIHITKNRHGKTYKYFVCSGRHEKRNTCDKRAVRISDAEIGVIKAIEERMTLDPETRQQLEDFLVNEITAHLRDSSDEQDRQQQRLKQLKAERTKLLQAHYADAISLDHLKEEQTRITHEMTSARTLLVQADVTLETIEAAIQWSLARTDEPAKLYKKSGAKFRRELNQAFFENVFIGWEEGELRAKLSEEYELLLHPDVLEAARDRAKALDSGFSELEAWLSSPQTKESENEGTPSFAGQGSSKDYLVGAEGLEPPTLSV